MRLLDLLAAELAPDHVLDEVANDLQLAPMAIFLPETAEERDWFHNLVRQARQRESLEALRMLLQQLVPGKSAQVGELWQLTFAQPELVLSRSEALDAPAGRFALVLETAPEALRLAELDTWLKGLIDAGTVSSMSIRGVQLSGTPWRPITHLHLSTTSRDYVTLWSQVGAGLLSHLGPHWIIEVGHWHSDSPDAEDLEDTLVPRAETEGLPAETGRPEPRPPEPPPAWTPRFSSQPSPEEEPSGLWDRLGMLGQLVGLRGS